MITFIFLATAFTVVKSQTNTDSIAKSILTIPPQMIYPEKIYRQQENTTNKITQKQDCEESENNRDVITINHEKTNQERIAHYNKMIEELKGEKNKLESKGQNTNEIDRKIEKLRTLILNLSK